MRSVISFFAMVVLIIATIPASAQTKSGAKGSTQSKAPAPAKKSSSENTCDGALDIVPSETLSFQRKRRPPTPKPTTESAEKKTEN
jgi:hypothetical protein